MSVYEQLAAKLLGVEDFPLLLPPMSVKNLGGLSDEDDQRLCAVVCGSVPGISAERWETLSEEQRVGWMREAVAKQTPEAVWLGDGRVRVGDKTIALEFQESNVVEALVELRAAMKSDLVKKSGVEDAVVVLKKLRK